MESDQNRSVTIQALTPRTLTLKINQGTNSPRAIIRGNTEFFKSEVS